MKAFKNKFELWTKYMQAGKTQIMIDDIVSRIDDDSVRDIIFCSNNLLLTEQTKNRVAKIEETDARMTNFIFSSSSKTNTLEKAQAAIQERRIMFACSNTVRFTDIPVLIANVCKNKKVTIFIDEVHTAPFKHIKEMAKLEAVKRIVGITATPDNLFANFNCYIKVRAMPSCITDIYYGWDDCTHILKDYDDGLPDFLSKYERGRAGSKIAAGVYLYKLLSDKTLTFNNSDIIFAPGSRYQISHQCIRDILLHFGFNVFVFNSNTKEDGAGFYLSQDIKIPVPLPTGKDIDGKDIDHIGTVMAILREKIPEKYRNKPLGITGHLSIGQGSTLADWDRSFFITKAVFGFPEVESDSGRYHEFLIQLVGRSFGNHKKQNPDLKVELFMTTRFYEQAREYVKSGALSAYVQNKEISELSMSFEQLILARREMVEQDEKMGEEEEKTDFIDEDSKDEHKSNHLGCLHFESNQTWEGLKSILVDRKNGPYYSRNEAKYHFGSENGNEIYHELLELNKRNNSTFIDVAVELNEEKIDKNGMTWNDIRNFAKEFEKNNTEKLEEQIACHGLKFICIATGTEIPIKYYCFYDR